MVKVYYKENIRKKIARTKSKLEKKKRKIRSESTKKKVINLEKYMLGF